MTETWPEAALVLVAHGSRRRSEACELILKHANAIRDAKLFGTVACGFWQGKPALSEVLSSVDEDIVFVVPVFKSDGHFTQVIIPREMSLTGTTSERVAESDTQRVHLCPPVGLHPGIPGLVGRIAADACVAAGFPMPETSILIVGHGGKESRGSEQATARVVEAVAENGGFGSVHGLYLEQDPLIETWRDAAVHSNIVVVPFLIGGGGHEVEIGARMTDNKLWVTAAVGEHDELARMIVDQVRTARPV